MAKSNTQEPDYTPPVDKQVEEAKQILDRVHRESETVGASSIARTAEQFKKRVSGMDGIADDDPIEVLGKKIGRTLGWVAVVLLIIYLLNTYVF